MPRNVHGGGRQGGIGELTEVIGEGRRGEQGPIRIGSVKSNVGTSNPQRCSQLHQGGAGLAQPDVPTVHKLSKCAFRRTL